MKKMTKIQTFMSVLKDGNTLMFIRCANDETGFFDIFCSCE